MSAPDRRQSPVSERYTRRSVAVVEPTTRVEKKQSSPRVLPLPLMQALEHDPAFRVTTPDGSAYIDPILGKRFPLAGQPLETVAKAALRQHLSTWRERGALSLDEVQERAWRFMVLDLLASEKRRMTIFSRRNGQWLNPYSGCLEPTVTRDDGKITATTVKAMAAVLAHCPCARRDELLSREKLRELKMRHGYQDPNEGPETTRYVRQ